MIARRITITILVTVALCGLAVASSTDESGVRRAAAQTARVVVTVGDAVIEPGGTTLVEITVENVASLWSGQIALRFDPAIVRVVDVDGDPAEAIEGGEMLEPGQTTEFINAVDSGAGVIEYAATLRNNPRRPVDPASGTGTFARFHLEGVRAGSSPLAFSTEGATYVREIKFVDGDLEAFTLPMVDGSLSVAGGSPPAIYLPLTSKGYAARTAATGGVVRGLSSMIGLRTHGAARGDAPDRLLDDPELIAETGGRAIDVAVSGGYVYWTEGPAEFECESAADEGSIERVNIATGATETLAQRCDLSPGSLVVDGSSLFYISVGEDAIIGTGTEAGPGGVRYETLVAPGNGLSSLSPLDYDATHLYFSDRDGIKRVVRTGGTPEVIAAGHTTDDMAVDGGYAYWTDSGTPHAVYRVPVAGGTPEALYESSGSGWMSGIAVDATHVYWTHSGGMARRVSKTGGDPEDYDTAGSWLTGDIAVNDSHVFWSDEVRLRRAPKDRSDVPEALALDFPGVKGLHATDSALIWAGGRSTYGIWQIPLAASEVTVDLRINFVEVTQAIQDLWGHVPLVAGKATLVRVYPASDWAYTHDVPMRLVGLRGGVELPGSPLTPIVPTVTVGRDGAERERLDETFNFLLPESWTEGTVALRAEINPDGTIPEANTTNNRLTETVTFEHRDAMCLEMVQVRTEPRSGSTHSAGFDEIMSWVESAYPVPGLRIRRGGMVEEPEVCIGFFPPIPFPLPYPCPGPYEMPGDSSSLLAGIWWYNLWDFNESGCDTTFYVGMVHQDGIARDGTIGASYVGGRELWAMMDTSPDVLGGAWPWFLPFGGAIMAHELGHSLNRRHVDCGDPDAGSIQAGYPYNRCDIGNDDPASYYGMDVLDMALIPPTEAGDLMSYAHNDGKPVWPSDWTYRALMGGLPGDFADFDGPTGDLVDAIAQSAESLAVTGVVSPTEGTAAITSARRLPHTLVGPGKLATLASRASTGPAGAYTLVLRDGAGASLRDLRFDLPEDIDAPDDVRAFQLVLPYEPATARIALVEGANDLATRDVSASAPTVKVISPNGGEVVAGPLTVTWDAEDPDDDMLLYTVQYSPDAGTSWQPLAVDVVSKTLTVDDMTTVPGSEKALVRVIAADGVNTASDVSDGTFTVARMAPEVIITRPDDGAVVAPGQQILASGRAYDPEDGTLDGDQLRWLADGAPVGRGAYVAIPPLDPGEHTITLRAVDLDQETGEDSITIYVQDLPCDNADAVDVVFVLDTAPPMAPVFDDACHLTKDVVQALQSTGLNVRYNVLGVTQRRGCAKTIVRDLVKGTSVDHPSDWGVAVHDLSLHYRWRPGAARLIVPISNQGPENGDPVEDPGPDRDVIDRAKKAARRGDVRVAPVIMVAGLGPQPEPPDMPVARSLAAATGGKAFMWNDQPQAIAGAIAELIPTGACVPSVTGVSPVCGFEPGATFTLYGTNLAVGTQVTVGPYPAVDVAANVDGTRLTFKLPPDLLPGRTYDVRVERTGVGGETLSGAVTNGPCSDRCDDYQAGDIALPMWLIRADRGDVVFEARATSDELTARLYAHDGPVKLLVQHADGTGIASAGVLAGTTGEVTVDAVPGNTYLVIARNAHAPATRFRLYARGVEYLRTADDGDDWTGPPSPGRGENNGAASHPELGFAGRWRDLGPEFATTTWYFDVAPGDAELAVHVWSEGLLATGHAGMAWVRPDGTTQPLVGPEGSGFDHTWRVDDPAAGMWGLRIEAEDEDAPEYIVTPDEPSGEFPEILYFFPAYVPQGYSLSRLGQPADDWLYFLPESMFGPPCGPSLVLVPGAAEVCVGGVHRMDIVLADVANLYGAEVHLVFDKDRLRAIDENGEAATQVIPGPFLDPAQGLLGANAVDNAFGLIDYAVSLKDPAVPAFGTGVLGTVFFEAMATGRSEIKVDEVKLSERPLPPAPAVRLVADARGAVFEASDCYNGGQNVPGTVRGRVVLDGRADHGGARVNLGAAGPFLTKPGGGYEVTGARPGEHTVDVRMAGYLRAGPRGLTLDAGGSVDLPVATLLGGDCNGSDEIDIVDGAISAAYYGRTEGWAAGKHPDINADGVVDIFDLVMVGNNFGCALDDESGRCQRWDRR